MLSEKRNLKTKRVDGLLTMIINAAMEASKDSEGLLISLIDEDICTIVGFVMGNIRFLRSFKISRGFFYEKEVMATLAYYEFSPVEKLLYYTREKKYTEKAFYFYDNRVFEDLTNEKLSI